MKYIQPRLSASLLAIAVIGSGCNQTSNKLDSGVTTFEEATLTVTPTASFFPNTAVGVDSAPIKFTLTNIGFEPTGPVAHTLSGNNANEFLITASTCGQPLAYMVTCEVSVAFRPNSAGSKSAQLNASATPGKMFSVILNATSQAPSSVRLQPTVLDFPVTPIPSPTGPAPVAPIGMFTVTNSGGALVSGLTATIEGQDPAEFAIADDSCAGTVLSPQTSCTISVRFKPTTSGAKMATLLIEGVGVKLPTATLSGAGAEPAKLSINPISQSFGAVPLGMKSAFSFELRNDGGSDTGKLNFSLEGINFAEFSMVADDSCKEAPIKPDQGCAVTVTFSPTLPGVKTASLRVTASPGGMAKADLTATAMSGTNSQITLTSPAPDPFGTVSVGDSSTGFFVVENKGTADAEKVMASISGSNSTEFVVTDNGCPDKLAVDTSCGITVRFSPQIPNRRTANLQVRALAGGFAILPISGNATTGAQLRITPTSRMFSARNIGSTTNIQTQQFTITNIGTTSTGPLTVVVEGTDANSFEMIGFNDCMNTTLLQNRSCRVDIRFLPKVRGSLTAAVAASATPGGVVRASVWGQSN